MEIHIAVAANTQSMVVEDYTASTGLYVGAYVQDQFANEIILMAEDLQIPKEDREEREELHCTLMYSRDAAPKRLPAIKGTIQGMVTGIQHWVGHNGKIYVVADVCSMDLIEAHAALTRAGAKHSFSKYAPHITLGKLKEKADEDFEARVEEINLRLKANPIHMLFVGIKATDINQD